MRFFNNLCKLIGLIMVALALLLIVGMVLLFTYDYIYNNYIWISESVTALLLVFGGVWIVCKLIGVKFGNFLGM